MLPTSLTFLGELKSPVYVYDIENDTWVIFENSFWCLFYEKKIGETKKNVKREKKYPYLNFESISRIETSLVKC